MQTDINVILQTIRKKKKKHSSAHVNVLPPLPTLIQVSLLELVWQGLAGSLLGVPVCLSVFLRVCVFVSYKHTFVYAGVYTVRIPASKVWIEF